MVLTRKSSGKKKKKKGNEEEERIGEEEKEREHYIAKQITIVSTHFSVFSYSCLCSEIFLVSGFHFGILQNVSFLSLPSLCCIPYRGSNVDPSLKFLEILGVKSLPNHKSTFDWYTCRLPKKHSKNIKL